MEVPSNHGVVHEGVAVGEVAEDGASVGEKRGVARAGCGGEKQCEIRFNYEIILKSMLKFNIVFV